MLALLGLSVVMIATFIFIEKRVAQPMMDLRLFQNRLFSVNLLTGFMVFIAMSGTILLMPFYLEGILGHTTEQVGLLMAVVPLATGLIAPFSGSLSDRIGTRPMTVAGLGVLVMGFLAVSTLSLTTTSLGYILRFLPVGLGLGIFQSPNNSAIMGAAPRDRLGVVSGLLALTRTVGQTTGIALVGAVWASSDLRARGPGVSRRRDNRPRNRAGDGPAQRLVGAGRAAGGCAGPGCVGADGIASPGANHGANGLKLASTGN